MWEPYEPGGQSLWDVRRVVHLHRRAGFAATWSEIQRDLKDGPQAGVTRLIKGGARVEGTIENFEQTADEIGEAAVLSDNPDRLKAWWIFRMLFSPDPLGERLALMWHNHFATSNLKLRDLVLMRRQNDLFRTFARAPFAKLLGAVMHDPAILIWLDAPSNVKGKPNENLAREVMELFTLGVGNYSERDIKEAARALTGWSVAGAGFARQADAHDDGQKQILGRKGLFDGDDLLNILLEHPACPRRLAWRICSEFMGEGMAEGPALDQLAAGLRSHELDVGWAVQTVLRSKLFFSDANIGTKIIGPVEFVTGPAHALELFDPPPSTLVLSEWVERLGLSLFYPPNVGGWTGGRGWLTTRAIIARGNYAAALARGELSVSDSPPDLRGMARHAGRDANLRDGIAFFNELLLGGRIGPRGLDDIRVRAGRPGAPDADPLTIAVALILASPEAQLG